MKHSANKNDHKRVTPSTKGAANKQNDRKFTSYDTSKPETSTPQEVREAREPEGEQARDKKAK